MGALVPMVAPPVAPASTRRNDSKGISTIRSPATATATRRVDCPGAKVTVPAGSTPPAKSAASAG